MLTYNRFWHFWSTLDKRHYFRAVTTTAAITLTVSFFFLPILWIAAAIAIASSAAIALVGYSLTQLSDFMFARRNQQLQHLKRNVDPNDTTSTDAQFNQQIDLYINQRIVYPKELLTGQLLNLSRFREPIF